MKIILDACRNHLGDNEIISEMIKQAKEVRADYIKFQLYKSDQLSSYFKGKRPTYRKHEITREKLGFIKLKCFEQKITPMFTIFNDSCIDDILMVMETTGPVQIPYAVKVASPDMSNHQLIAEIVKTFSHNKREIFISTGMHSEKEIKHVKIKFDDYDIKWFYCISMYPCPHGLIDFKRMQDFDGFSDHSMGISMSRRALDYGTKYIEKHFTLGRDLPGKDQQFAITPEQALDLANYRNYLKSIEPYKMRFRVEEE